MIVNLTKKLNELAYILNIQKKQHYVSVMFSKEGYSSSDSTKTPTYNRFIEFIQRVTLSLACEECAKHLEGDIIEIGAAEGWTTVLFAEIAKKYGKRVIVIDPFNGEECGTEQLYNDFLRSKWFYKDEIYHLRVRSDSQEGGSLLRSHKSCFTYVDGLHSGETPMLDIINSFEGLAEGGVMAVDDTENLNSVVGKFLKDFVDKNERLEFLNLTEGVWSELMSDKTWHFTTKKI